jgi:AMP phosphorylase
MASEACLQLIHKKIAKGVLSEEEFAVIINEIVDNKFSDAELSAFFVAIAATGLTDREIVDLAKVLIGSGNQLQFDRHPVITKHSIGGIPGNEVSLIIVPVVAAAGLTVPKTATHAITSPCGTLDVAEMFCPVELSPEETKQVVEKTNGCIVSGKSVGLAPAIDRILDAVASLRIDPRQLMIASILSKTAALNVDYLLMDIPTGKKAKATHVSEAERLAIQFTAVGQSLDLKLECAITPGDKPVGTKLGVALEAASLLQTLRNEKGGEKANKSTSLAGIMLELVGKCEPGAGKAFATEIIKSGKALGKLKEIVEAQGGSLDVDLSPGRYTFDFTALAEGVVYGFDNQIITSVAHLAGAPTNKEAGMALWVKRGDEVEKGQKLFTIYSGSESMLEKAVDLAQREEAVLMERPILKVVRPKTLE